MDIEQDLQNDLLIDESNILGEIRKIKEIYYKWSTRITKEEDAYKKKRIEYDRILFEKHKYYSTQYDTILKGGEIRIYVSGDKDIIEYKNDLRKFETKLEFLKHALFAIKEKSKELNILYNIIKNENR